MEMVYYHSPPQRVVVLTTQLLLVIQYSQVIQYFNKQLLFNPSQLQPNLILLDVTFTGDAVYQGSSRHTANVSIRASLAVQQFEFTSNTGQTLFKGSSDSQGLLSYTYGSISVYKDGVKLRPVVDFAETDSSTITLQDGTSNNNIITIEQYGSEQFKHFTYVATRGQTTFSGADALGESLSYTANNLLGGGVKVYLNGVRLRANTDVVATNGTEVVLQDGAGNNDVVMIESLGLILTNHLSMLQVEGNCIFWYR